jgi:hypothetical protein
MEELIALVAEMEDNINSFLADAKKEIAPKSAWQRARKMTILLQKQFKQFRSLSVEVSKTMKKEKE